MAGLISFMGRDGAQYLMGWTGGYVLLALLLAPYLRKFGKFTVPDFVGDRYYSSTARVVALFCAIFVSFTYVAGQMRGVGVVFSRFLEVDVVTGVLIGMGVVFFYATLGGMKGITYTQVAQYVVMIFAFMVPAIFISIELTGIAIPQIGFGAEVQGSGKTVLESLNGLSTELGFDKYTEGQKPMIDVFFTTAALMIGTAGLPHVIVRFFTVSRVKDARLSAGFALVFIAILYTTAPAVAAFARTNLLQTVAGKEYKQLPGWFKTWENTALIAWVDKNNDGVVNYVGPNKGGGKAFTDKPAFEENANGEPVKGSVGQNVVATPATDNANELYVDRDIMVLANPEIAQLPPWVIALVAAGGMAAALSTAAGLLLVISSSVSHDLLKRTFMPNISESQEMWAARGAIAVAIVIAGYFGINPPGFVAQVVAFAFGLAASSFFPAIILGIFNTRMNKEGAIAGMITGILFTSVYIIYFKFVNPSADTTENHLFGISCGGIGTLGMVLNLVVSLVVSNMTPAPPQNIQELVQDIRYPRGAGEAVAH
jgi:cation/acetate symporter